MGRALDQSRAEANVDGNPFTADRQETQWKELGTLEAQRQASIVISV